MTIVARGLGLDEDELGSIVAFGLTTGRFSDIVETVKQFLTIALEIRN